MDADIAQLYASPSTFEELFATFDLSPIKIEASLPSASLSEIDTDSITLKRKKAIYQWINSFRIPKPLVGQEVKK